jgi:hypothetical protein
MADKKVTIELYESDLKFLIYALGKAELWHIAVSKETTDPDNVTTKKEFRQWKSHKVDKCFMLACDLETEHENNKGTTYHETQGN